MSTIASSLLVLLAFGAMYDAIADEAAPPKPRYHYEKCPLDQAKALIGKPVDEVLNTLKYLRVRILQGSETITADIDILKLNLFVKQELLVDASCD
jgi:hypothetical protein